MSEVTDQDDRIPPWTTGWRLQRALDWAGISIEQMARELDVSRSTISRWCNDRGTPRMIYLRAWAFRCRVPLDWLLGGETMSSTERLTTSTAAPSNREQIHALRKHIRHPELTPQKAVER